MTDVKTDPRFTKLPQQFIDQIKKAPPLDTDKGGHSWHEVQFDMGGVVCQCAVVDGEYVNLPQEEIDQFVRIIKIWTKEELSP